MVRQSMPFVYLSVTAESLDGSNHTLRLHSDVTGGMSFLQITLWLLVSFSHDARAEFCTGDWNALAKWDAWDDGQHIALNMSLVSPIPFGENMNYAMDGTEVFGFKRASPPNIKVCGNLILFSL